MFNRNVRKGFREARYDFYNFSSLSSLAYFFAHLAVKDLSFANTISFLAH